MEHFYAVIILISVKFRICIVTFCDLCALMLVTTLCDRIIQPGFVWLFCSLSVLLLRNPAKNPIGPVIFEFFTLHNCACLRDVSCGRDEMLNL